MKTYLRRWWIINRLYHFIAERGGERWFKESDFCAWIGGTDLKTELAFDASGNFRTNNVSWLYRKILSLLYNARNYNTLFSEIRNDLQQCADKQWIKRENQNGVVYVNLDTIGMEKYAVSSLVGIVLGNEYVKKFLFWAIPFIVLWFFDKFLKLGVSAFIYKLLASISSHLK